MKRVLIITYYWPPSGGSGVQRWVKFAKYLPSEGWQPVVYTPENPELTTVDTSLEAEIPASVEVLRTPIVEPYGLYRKMMGKSASRKEVTPITSGKKGLKQRIMLWVRANLFVPDPRVSWVRPSVRYLKEYLKKHPVDLMITTGPPQSMHLIGLQLHRDTGIPWVADFRDPWSRHYSLPYLPLSGRTWRKIRRLEQEVLDECSTVLTVTPFVQKEYEALTRTPVAMITNGYDEEDFAADVIPDGYFNLTQTGYLAADGNPVVLWKVLGEMAGKDPAFREQLRIRLAGLVDEAVYDAIDQEGLTPNLVDLGYCSHVTAIREQQAASVLLIPLRNAPEMRSILPGKVFEYMAARRPVLGFGQPDGIQAQLLRETGAGITCDWEDEAGARAFIRKAWDQHLAGGVPATKGDVARYSRRSLTRQLAGLLDQVAEKQ